MSFNHHKNKNKCDINLIQIGKRQLHFIQLNHFLFDLNKLLKDTAFIYTICKREQEFVNGVNGNMKAVSFESLFKLNKTWLSRIK